MGTLSIDLEQSAQIVKLQEDVEELTTKLNAVVTDIATIKGKVDTLITDVTGLKDKIGDTTYGNTGSGLNGSASDPILKRLHEMDGDFVSLSDAFRYHEFGSYQNKHSVTNGSQTGRTGGGGAGDASYDLTGASTSSSGSVSQTASAASTTGAYSTSNTNVVTIASDSATRAREVARSTLAALRR